MSTTSEEPTIHELLSRLAELEQAHARLQEELTNVRTERVTAEEQTSTQTRPRPRRSSRRKVLEKGLGVAVATVGAGTLLELSSGTALAASTPKPGVFASSVAGTPAVKATGTNGADGVDATSDSGTGVSAKSSSGTGIFAQSSSFNAIHAVGGGTGVSALFAEGGTGFGVFATSDTLSGSGDGVRGSSHGSGNGVTGISALPGGTGNGVVGIGHPGDGVVGFSDSGNAIHGIITPGGTGLAGRFDGNVSMSNKLAVAGTLSSGAGALASSVSGTPAVKATGTNGADGVDATSDSGIGVSAISTSGNGIFAQSGSFDAIHAIGGGGVRSALFAEGGTGFGVFANSSGSDGVRGTSFSSSNNGVTGIGDFSTGVAGVSANSTGVFGTGGSVGVHGISPGLAGLFDGNVQVNGNFSVTGIKAFVQAHPTDPSREIVYVALEGGEAGTYVRGTGTLVNGKAVIELPEHFGLVTNNESLTIQLTSRGEWLQLYLVELDTAQIVVREAQGKSGAFDYLVYGVRRGYEQHEVIRTKR